MKVEINLPRLVYVDDYHYLPVMQRQMANLLPSVIVEEVGFIAQSGQYVGVVICEGITRKEVDEFLESCDIPEESLYNR